MKAVSSLCANREATHEIMQEEHDVPMARCCGERTTRMVVRKKFY
jgi:hypothetical protein